MAAPRSSKFRPSNFDPPDHGTSTPRPLTAEELQAVWSGSGYTHKAPFGSAETNQELHAWRSRGLYPRPGIYYEMIARDPKIASGLDQNESAVRGLDWRLLAPKDADAVDLVRMDFVIMCLEAMGGLVEISARTLDKQLGYGFGLFEEVWEIEESTGWWRLEDLLTIEPWCVDRWVLDGRGFARGAMIRDSGGVWMLPIEKAALMPRKFTGRNYEGRSVLRPLYYTSEAKRRTFVGLERAHARFGDGVIVFKLGAGAGEDGEAKARAVIEEWAAGDQMGIVIPFGMDFDFRHGGSVIPDNSGAIKQFDHIIGTVLGDNLSELGHTAHGSRAVGGEMRRSFERGAKGVCLGLCQMIQDQIIRPIYLRNGWDPRRMATPYVSGFEDPAWLSMVISALQSGVIEKVPADQEKLRRATGLG